MILRRLLIQGAWALVVLLPSAAVALVSSIHGAPEPRPVVAPKPVVAPVRVPAPIVPAKVAATAKPATPAPAIAEFKIKRVLEGGAPIRFGEYLWDDSGVPPGPIVITVDLAAETLSVFRDGYEIGATAILFGDDGKPTPLGTFPITQKDAHHVSSLYDAPMPYMLRLTNDGISIHGSKVAWGYATHGCVGVPVEFAKRLFAITRLGDQVIITRGPRRAGSDQPTVS
jgi:hypothetical protein